jgi:hypothetical protein
MNRKNKKIIIIIIIIITFFSVLIIQVKTLNHHLFIYKRARKDVCWLFVALLASMYAPHAHLHRVVCRRSSFSSLVFLNRGLLLALSSCRREQIEEQYHIIVDDNDVVCMVSCVVFSFSFLFFSMWLIFFA